MNTENKNSNRRPIRIGVYLKSQIEAANSQNHSASNTERPKDALEKAIEVIFLKG